MKKEWFITIDGERKGAYTFEELIKLDIYDDLMVWKAGWEDWKKVTELEELKEHIILTPPPIIKNVESKKQLDSKVTEYTSLSSTFNKEIIYFVSFALVFGLILNFLFYSIAKDGGSDLYPIYLTNEERANPMIIFWNQLPYSLSIAAIIFFIIYMFKRMFFNENNSEKISKVSINDNKEYKLSDGRLMLCSKSGNNTDAKIDGKFANKGFYKIYNKDLALYVEGGLLKSEHKLIRVKEHFYTHPDSDYLICDLNFSGNVLIGANIWLKENICPDTSFVYLNKTVSVKDGKIVSIT